MTDKAQLCSTQVLQLQTKLGWTHNCSYLASYPCPLDGTTLIRGGSNCPARLTSDVKSFILNSLVQFYKTGIFTQRHI